MKTKWMSETSLARVRGAAVVDRKPPCRRSSRGHESPSRLACDDDRSWRPLQVIVIVDEQDTSDRLAALVRQWGHDAHAVDNGLSALRMAATTKPNVVLLCGGTSMTNRCQLARRLRAQLADQDCLIAAITGQADQRHRQRCIEAGIDLVLSTPVDSGVVETLLLLECTRLNRFAAGLEGSHGGLNQNPLEQGEMYS